MYTDLSMLRRTLPRNLPAPGGAGEMSVCQAVNPPGTKAQTIYCVGLVAPRTILVLAAFAKHPGFFCVPPINTTLCTRPARIFFCLWGSRYFCFCWIDSTSFLLHAIGLCLYPEED